MLIPLNMQPEEQKPIRVLLPQALYKRLKLQCPDHGMLSQLIRRLLEKHLTNVEST